MPGDYRAVREPSPGLGLHDRGFLGFGGAGEPREDGVVVARVRGAVGLVVEDVVGDDAEAG